MARTYMFELFGPTEYSLRFSRSIQEMHNLGIAV